MEEMELSRQAVITGELNRSRRAAKLLSAIEARCLHMRGESHRVVAAFLFHGSPEGTVDFKRHFQGDYFRTIKMSAAPHQALQLDHLERFVPQWKSLVPADPELRARVLRLMRQKYGASPTVSPRTFTLLGAATPEVQAAYQRLYGESPDAPMDGRAGSTQKEQSRPDSARREAGEDIEAGLEWLSLASGQVLYREGDPSDAVYVIISGRMVALTTNPDGSEHLVDNLGRGELVGELGALTGEPRSATLRAARDSELVRLGRNELLSLAQKHLQVMTQLNVLLARRLHMQYAKPGRTEHNVLAFALVPCDASVPWQDFGRQLAQALGELGPANYVTSAQVDDAIETGAAQATLDDPRNAQIVAWLSELETRYHYLVYEAAPEVSEWSRRCIRQADHILLLGRAGASPLPAAHETALRTAQAQTELVLLQKPDASSLAGTAAWLEPRAVHAHHHVRLDNREDLGHLARRLTGRGVGVVLSGGGARGFGHIGALRALHEAGIGVDWIGGTSMGALMGGAYAMGMDDTTLKEFALEIGSREVLLDRTLPIISMYSTHKITKLIRKMAGSLDIEDLWLPFFAVSCNLSKGSQMVHTAGPLWLAVRASMAASPIFTPVHYKGDLLVDGGVLNNLPVDVMRRQVGNATVLGIDCSPLAPKAQTYEFGPSISGWQALRYQMTPAERRKGPPNMVGLAAQIMDANGLYRQQFVLDQADHIVRLPARSWGMLDFDDAAEIIELGYHTTREQLAAWLPTRRI